MLGLVSFFSLLVWTQLTCSCLDDPELALLGVPWETYRQVANDIGLDVIRLVEIAFCCDGRGHSFRVSLLTVAYPCLMVSLPSL